MTRRILTAILLTAIIIGVASASEPCPPFNSEVTKKPQPVAATRQIKASAVSARSLYDRLGGEAAITAVVDDFVARAAANPKVNITRKGTKREWHPSPENVARLKKHLVQLVCMVTGGPHKYEGKGMVMSNFNCNNLEADSSVDFRGC